MLQWIITEDEDEKLNGLNHSAQVGYMRGIRPFMDKHTGIAGIKGTITYSYISRVCQVKPARGRHHSEEYKPSRKKGRVIVDTLEAAGLVSRIPAPEGERQLILRCNWALLEKSKSGMRGHGGAGEGHTQEGHTKHEASPSFQTDDGPHEGHTKTADEGPKSEVRSQIEENPSLSPQAADTKTAKPKPKARRRQLPQNTTLTEQWQSEAARIGVTEPAQAFEAFCDYHRAKGTTMADWTAAWRTWCRNAVKFETRGSRGGGSRYRTQADLDRDIEVTAGYLEDV